MTTPSNELPPQPNPAPSAKPQNAASASTVTPTALTSTTADAVAPLPELTPDEKIELLRSMALLQEAELRRLQMKVDVIGGAVKELHQLFKRFIKH